MICYDQKCLLFSTPYQKLQQLHTIHQFLVNSNYETNIELFEQKISNNDILNQLITDLMNIYKKQKSNQNKYEISRFILSLIQLSQEQFNYEFSIDTNDQLQLIVKSLTDSWVKNIEHLTMRANISKYLEFSYINLSFNNNFKLETISDEVLERLFINVESRLQKVDSLKEFIIIHDVHLNMIHKFVLQSNSLTDVDKIIDSISLNLCDIIVVSSIKFDKLERLKIRYLNYVGRGHELNLQYPEYLVSTTLCNVKIVNINQCINLQNIYSEWNTYQTQDFKSLTNIKRVYTMLDTYTNETISMTEQIFSTNKLEYLSIVQEDDSESNIITSCILQNNIQNLRYVYIFIESYCKVTINVENKLLPNLLMFDVTSVDENGNEIYGIIAGNQSVVNQIQKQLIHTINQNSV